MSRRVVRVAVLAAVAVALLALASSVANAEMLRIPIRRLDVNPGQHFRTSRSVVAHAQRHFARETTHGTSAAPSHHHEQLKFYSDPPSQVALRNFYNRMYVGDVYVGTPQKKFSLVFDTGSADMWLFAAANNQAKLDFVTYYDYTQSSTGVKLATPWQIQYGKGSSSGNLVRDSVSLANKQATAFTFAQATTYSEDFESEDMPLDGLLGLAFQQVNNANGPTLLDTLQSQGKIRDRVFSFYLTTDNPDGSEFILGSPDASLMKSGQNLTYLDVQGTSGMWLLSMQQVRVNGADAGFCSSCSALIDTGTSFIGMPTSAFNSFAGRVSAARPDCLVDGRSGLIRCDQDTSDGIPSMAFSIQGSLFQLSGADLYDQGILAVMPIDSSSSGRADLWILGDTFLRRYYSVFDMDNRRIGIVGATPGAPYTRPSNNSSVFSNGSWQLILLIVGIALVVLCFVLCMVRLCRRKHSQPALAARSGGHRLGGDPYVLQPPPTFASEPMRHQPGRGVANPHVSRSHAAGAVPVRAYPASGQEGYPAFQAQGVVPPGGTYVPPAAYAPRSNAPPLAQPQSDFARDFYAAGGGR